MPPSRQSVSVSVIAVHVFWHPLNFASAGAEKGGGGNGGGVVGEGGGGGSKKLRTEQTQTCQERAGVEG